PAGDAVVIGMDRRWEARDSVEIKLLELRAALRWRIDPRKTGPEFGDRTASGESRFRMRIRKRRFEDHVQSFARLAGDAREDHSVLAAIRSVRRRHVESID